MATLTVIPDPRFLRFDEWAMYTMDLTNNIGYVPQPYYVSWQEWGAAFINSPSVRHYSLPNPYQFPDWEDWARDIIQVSRAGQ